ncbi:type IV pilus assembly protein PilO [Geothermobacter ehrlichii]|uniref:Type IV pilus assembly protein PilO n=1 Tax=Geothermobacter ehrlichii TaxID=213224 RepID=A0A5D3WK59_9BACT|nr:type 4a pilus biogenesis protein PilO [Geothermobacter ehrlichii]TYO98738.1 type IV pilus assembly protein PilO [Geothermobacter ehrlichii]
MSPATFVSSLWRLNRWIPVLLALLLVADLGSYLYLARVINPGLYARERTFIELQQRARQARRTELAARNPRQVFRKGQKDLEQFLARVPGQDELSALVGDLFAMARKAGLDIKAVDYRPKPLPEQGLIEYALSFSVAGEYGQVKRFIYLIEKSERLVVVDQLNLDRGRKDEGTVRLSIRMTTYFRRGEA